MTMKLAYNKRGYVIGIDHEYPSIEAAASALVTLRAPAILGGSQHDTLCRRLDAVEAAHPAEYAAMAAMIAAVPTDDLDDDEYTVAMQRIDCGKISAALDREERDKHWED